MSDYGRWYMYLHKRVLHRNRIGICELCMRFSKYLTQKVLDITSINPSPKLGT